MQRREALRLMSLTLGTAFAGSVLAETAMRYPDHLWQTAPEGVSADDLQLLAELADTLIPATDTPGAKEAGAHNVIPVILRDCYPEHDQRIFWAGLRTLQMRSERQMGCDFLLCKPVQRAELCRLLENEYIALRTAEDTQPSFFKIMKDLTLVGFFTSEIGATQALRHSFSPGEQQGDIPYEAGQKAWSM